MEANELEILIATYGEEGLKRLARNTLPEMEGVSYLVSCQSPGHNSIPLPEELRRPDIHIIFTPTKGLSINRNNALEHATSSICLIADDDISFSHKGFETIIATFRNHPDLDFATFEYTLPDGSFQKSYPSYPFPLDKPTKGYYVTSFEIAFRKSKIKKSKILFNENFGLGNEAFGCGEEELWVHDLINAGFKGYFFPHVIAIHNDLATTGIKKLATPSVLRAQGAVITRLYPSTAFLRVLLKALRASKIARVSFISCLQPALQGWWQASVHPKRLFGEEK